LNRFLGRCDESDHSHFGDRDPTASGVEVNVRTTLFYPATSGLSYIRVHGFVLMNAATRWTPPNVEQQAAIGPNGGHDWVIEDNAILNSKGACLSIGVPFGPADGEKSGHHIIRNNMIMRCGQAGILGQTWNSHSLIRGNDIEDINPRLE
jgi:alpha-N-arabinofuranosidase